MERDQLLAPFERMLAQVFPPEVVRRIEQGGAWQAQWDLLEGSGYLDALVAENQGGAGLALGDLAPLLFALGRHAVPLPVGETTVARALFAEAGVAVPAGPLALATDSLFAPFAPAEATILRRREIAELLDASELRPIAALLRAAGIAGAADRVLTMTVAYAGERVQFGKPIGSRQAVQQQIAVMAEHTVAARLAVEMACATGFPPSPLACAGAKSVASVAAVQVAAIAHAVHGAIGISAEHDLQLYTRALHAWRLAEGSESYWNRVIGAAALRSGSDSVDWVRETLFARA